ncbi:Hypothetical protein FORC64_p265 (plasmid) [Escherichia coli]|nr:Hypothetical protein FORC64_p265 [Escherichia coli]
MELCGSGDDVPVAISSELYCTRRNTLRPLRETCWYSKKAHATYAQLVLDARKKASEKKQLKRKG